MFLDLLPCLLVVRFRAPYVFDLVESRFYVLRVVLCCDPLKFIVCSACYLGHASACWLLRAPSPCLALLNFACSTLLPQCSFRPHLLMTQVWTERRLFWFPAQGSNARVLERSNARMLECSNVRMLECPNVRMLECSNIRMPECPNT